MLPYAQGCDLVHRQPYKFYQMFQTSNIQLESYFGLISVAAAVVYDRRTQLRGAETNKPRLVLKGKEGLLEVKKA